MDSILYRRMFPVAAFAAALMLVWFLVSDVVTKPLIHTHTWAMTDYYAMALRFSTGEGSIFYPKTYNLQTKEAITSSDFAVQAWLVGKTMAIFKNDSPVVYRLSSLTLVVLAFIGFFRALRTWEVSWHQAIFVALLLWCTPVWVFYSVSPLPSIWAFSFFALGLSFFYEKKPKIALALMCMLLTALIRKPFVLYLFAVGGWIFIEKKSKKVPLVLVWLTTLGVFFLWQWHDQRLMADYGTLFLRQLMHAQSSTEAIEIAETVSKKWGLLWFSWPMLVAFSLSIFWVLKNKRSPHQVHGANLSLPLAFLGIGIGYFFLMQRQFLDHEYYAIDAFYPGIFAWALAVQVLSQRPRELADSIPKKQGQFSALLLLLVLWSVWSCHQGMRLYTDRKGMSSIVASTFDAYNSAGMLPKACYLPETAKVLAFEAYSFNLPLVALRREGWCSLSSAPKDLADFVQKPADFAVFLDKEGVFARDILSNCPNLSQTWSYYCRHKDLVLLKKVKQNEQRNPESLFGTSTTTLLDTLRVQSSDEFLLGQSLSGKPSTSGVQKILVYGYFHGESSANLVVSVGVFRQGTQLQVLESKLLPGNYEEKLFRAAELTLPESDSETEFRIYLWNPDKKTCTLENFRMVLCEGEKNILNAAPATVPAPAKK